MSEHVKNILGKIGTGITEPLIGEINNEQAIIKTFNNEESNRVLINELVCYKIAKVLDLPIPDGGICLIDNRTQLVDKFIIDSDKYGLGFYSKRLDKVTNVIDNPELYSKHIINKNDYIKIILFDNLVYNKDRHKGNLLISLKKKGENKLYIIDHTHVFKIGALWDKNQLRIMMESNDYNSSEVMEYNEATYRLLLKENPISKELLFETASYFKIKLTNEKLNNIILDIPIEWGIEDEEKEMLFKYLEYRINNLENICEVIYNYYNKVSGRW